jgi:hypothetical protein
MTSKHKIFKYFVVLSFSYMNKNIRGFLIGATIVAVALVLLFPISSYAQRLQPQSKNFVAILTGKDMVPPVDTKASEHSYISHEFEWNLVLLYRCPEHDRSSW